MNAFGPVWNVFLKEFPDINENKCDWMNVNRSVILLRSFEFTLHISYSKPHQM